ncbi:MAG: cyclic nucleotide-binding domain-containing protein, partial [Thioalkalispiraceae bacterium]
KESKPQSGSEKKPDKAAPEKAKQSQKPEVKQTEKQAEQKQSKTTVTEAAQVKDTENTDTAAKEMNPEKEATEKQETTSVEPSPEAMPATDEDRSWIRKMRHIMAFKNMPPANIKALLENMETILVKKDDVVVQQGSEGDYYYVLTEGEALVTRTVELATLGAGASFGEEALVSDAQRNASVTMKTDGMLMRLSKENFNALLKDPLLERVSPDEARQQVNKGAVWLDVRHAKEFAYARLPKAVNIPLHEVRLRLNELDKDKNYICYCSTGRRSSAAAFLLVQHGFRASVLNGGIKVMAQDLVH